MFNRHRWTDPIIAREKERSKQRIDAGTNIYITTIFFATSLYANIKCFLQTSLYTRSFPSKFRVIPSLPHGYCHFLRKTRKTGLKIGRIKRINLSKISWHNNFTSHVALRLNIILPGWHTRERIYAVRFPVLLMIHERQRERVIEETRRGVGREIRGRGARVSREAC